MNLIKLGNKLDAEEVGEGNENEENYKLDMPLIMTILLKETVLKLIKSVAPNLYKHRF